MDVAQFQKEIGIKVLNPWPSPKRHKQPILKLVNQVKDLN